MARTTSKGKKADGKPNSSRTIEYGMNKIVTVTVTVIVDAAGVQAPRRDILVHTALQGGVQTPSLL